MRETNPFVKEFVGRDTRTYLKNRILLRSAVKPVGEMGYKRFTGSFVPCDESFLR
jgi:hypothetical protein